jgi:short-subunit dehydrogenase
VFPATGALWTIFNIGVPFLPGLQSRTFFIDLEEGYAAQQNQKRHPQVLTITPGQTRILVCLVDECFMSRSLEGAVVAIIGASGGLGTPIVRKLQQRGARLLLVGPHIDRLTLLQDSLEIANTEIVVADLRDARCGDRIASAAERSGRLDGVINAAGLVGFGALLDTPDELIEELFLVNTLGPLWMIKRVAPMLRATKGFVVNISAVVAETPLPNMAAYSASKAALTAADTALHRELRRMEITICDVRPPHTETGLADHPITGVAPKLPTGLSPEFVAEVIVAAIESGQTEVPSTAFVG